MKEKIDVLTGLLRPPNAEDVLGLSPAELFSDEPLALHIGGNEKLLDEVIELRKANKTLEEQLRYTTMKPTSFPILKPAERNARTLLNYQ